MADRKLVVRLLSETRSYSQGMRSAQTSTATFERQIDRAKATTDRFGQGMLRGAGLARLLGVAAIGGALVGGLKAAINGFRDFENRLNQSLAIMGDVATAMREDMAGAARQMAQETLFSAGEAADAFYFLASAGLSAEQSIAALPQVTAFAQAGMFDLSTATTLATDAQAALGLKVGDAAQNLENLTRVTDVLTQAGNLSNATVEQFSQALTNKAASAARLVGVEIEEVVAVLAAFADQGLKGEAAGEAYAIILRDLQRAALEFSGEFRRAGVQVFDTAGELRPVADIIEDIEHAIDGMSDAQVRATISGLGFQDRSVSNLLALIGTTDQIRRYEEGLRRAGGVTEDVAERQLQTLSGQLELLEHRFQDIGIGLGEDLADPLKDEVIPALFLVADAVEAAAESFGPVLAGAIGLGADAITGLVFVLQGAHTELLKLRNVQVQLNPLATPEEKATAQAERDAAVRAQNLLVIQREMTRGQFAQMDSAIKLANGIADLAAKYSLNGETLAAVIQTSRANQTEQVAALRTARGLIATWGNQEATLRLLDMALGEGRYAMIGLNQEGDRFIRVQRRMRDSTGAIIPLLEDEREAFDEIAAAAQAAADKLEGELQGAFEGFLNILEKTPTNAQLGKVGIGQLIANATGQLDILERFFSGLATLAEAGLDNLVAEFQTAGPSSVRTLEGVLSDMDKGGTRAFELDELIGKGRDKSNELIDTIVDSIHAGEPTLFSTMRDLGVGLAQQLGAGFTSATLRLTITAALDQAQATQAAPNHPRQGTFSDHEIRQHGGHTLPGHRYLVGEAGVEMFEPATAGRIFSNPETRQLMSALAGARAPSSSSTSITVNHPRTNDLFGDIQLALMMHSVTDAVEGRA